MIRYTRPVRFEDLDAAGIVFFARYLGYGHEAMEHFFGALDGGYVRLIVERRIGLPAIHVDASYTSPLKYGDTVHVDTDVVHIGETSATLRYRMSTHDGRSVATIKHTCVFANLDAFAKTKIPDDARALLTAHYAEDHS